MDLWPSSSSPGSSRPGSDGARSPKGTHTTGGPTYKKTLLEDLLRVAPTCQGLPRRHPCGHHHIRPSTNPSDALQSRRPQPTTLRQGQHHARWHHRPLAPHYRRHGRNRRRRRASHPLPPPTPPAPLNPANYEERPSNRHFQSSAADGLSGAWRAPRGSGRTNNSQKNCLFGRLAGPHEPGEGFRRRTICCSAPPRMGALPGLGEHTRGNPRRS